MNHDRDERLISIEVKETLSTEGPLYEGSKERPLSSVPMSSVPVSSGGAGSKFARLSTEG